MAGNKLCPQDYCNMIKRFIDERSGCFFVIKRKFTESEVYNYCINHTEILDKGDDLLIKNIIRKLKCIRKKRIFIFIL